MKQLEPLHIRQETFIFEEYNKTLKNVCNIPRQDAREWSRYLDPEKNVWISINEPELTQSNVQNNVLESLPHLRVDFWDIESTVNNIKTRETIYPICDTDVSRIVRFIKQHEGKNFIVNCAAGVSRSGAIAKFLVDFLEYKWTSFGQDRTINRDRFRHNKFVYEKIRKEYFSV